MAEGVGVPMGNDEVPVKMSFVELLQVKIQSIWVQAIIAILVLLDILVLFLDEPWNDKPSENWVIIITWIILAIFAFEAFIMWRTLWHTPYQFRCRSCCG